MNPKSLRAAAASRNRLRATLSGKRCAKIDGLCPIESDTGGWHRVQVRGGRSHKRPNEQHLVVKRSVNDLRQALRQRFGGRTRGNGSMEHHEQTRSEEHTSELQSRQ